MRGKGAVGCLTKRIAENINFSGMACLRWKQCVMGTPGKKAIREKPLQGGIADVPFLDHHG
jgi:hypothetical protein